MARRKDKVEKPLDNTPVRPVGYLYGLRAENIMRLELVELKFDGPGLVIIEGENGEGKTALLTSAAIAMGAKIPDDPVHHGADVGKVDLDLGDRVAHFEVKPDRTATLQVMGKDGRPWPAPATMYDGLLGKLGLNPFRYLVSSDEEQTAILCDVAGLDVAILDAEADKVYKERTDINREVKKLEGQLAGMTIPDVALYEGVGPEVSVGILAQRHAAAVADKTKNDKTRADVARLVELHEMARATVESLKIQLDKAHAQERDLANARAEGERLAAAIKDPDLDAIAAEMGQVEQKNAAIRHAHGKLEEAARATAARTAKQAEIDERKAASNARTARLDAIDSDRKERLAKAQMPVAGLSVQMGRVMLDTGLGPVPFRQASEQQRLDAAAHITAARAQRLGLQMRVFIVDHGGNDFSLASLGQLGDWARANHYQILVERVPNGEPTGIVIQSGRVAADHRNRVPAPIQLDGDGRDGAGKPGAVFDEGAGDPVKSDTGPKQIGIAGFGE